MMFDIVVGGGSAGCCPRFSAKWRHSPQRRVAQGRTRTHEPLDC